MTYGDPRGRHDRPATHEVPSDVRPDAPAWSDSSVWSDSPARPDAPARRHAAREPEPARRHAARRPEPDRHAARGPEPERRAARGPEPERRAARGPELAGWLQPTVALPESRWPQPQPQPWAPRWAPLVEARPLTVGGRSGDTPPRADSRPHRDQATSRVPQSPVLPVPVADDGSIPEPVDAGPGPAERRAAASARRAGRRRAEPQPTAGGSWRTYLMIVTLLVFVVVGVAGGLWKSGRLKISDIAPTAPRPAAAAPGLGATDPGTATTVQPGPSPSAVATPPGVVDKGAGTFVTVATTGPTLGTAGAVRRFRVEVENGINEDPDAFAGAIDAVLGDPRSWIASGQFRLQRVPATTQAEFTVILASPTTSESLCADGGLHTEKFTSCRLSGKVIINDARWKLAIENYGAPLEVYRTYAINHEVGHQFGHGHEACTGPGQLAPVMQQQTYGLKGCVANPWPFVNGQRYAGPPIP